MSFNIISSDKETKTVKGDNLDKSKFLQAQFEANADSVSVDVKGSVLDLVIEYMDQYPKGTATSPIPQVLKSNDLKSELKNAWDVEFISRLTFEQVFNIINAASVLEMEHLHDLACARVAAFMKDKAPEDVNKEFTIECQLTSEEAKELGLEVGDEKEG
jgi:hypothetical protein